jgi:hypothetical protein
VNRTKLCQAQGFIGNYFELATFVWTSVLSIAANDVVLHTKAQRMLSVATNGAHQMTWCAIQKP